MFCFNFHGSILYFHRTVGVKAASFHFHPVPTRNSFHLLELPRRGTKSWTGMTVSGSESLVTTSIPEVAKFCVFQYISMIRHQNNSQTPASLGDIFEILVSKAVCAEATHAKIAG